ncbi:uncharacterized protein LOC102951978 isoform X2 [Panthera tigris]|uniref:uncharacterized protein LOC102951978 isoform X2 n=1 Tax=Panthera tigris TaxID=9694 RepID=UPI001C6FBCBA|nr:uncharacterized protein LOC102951978 isoform X2 [Panthera tigris]
MCSHPHLPASVLPGCADAPGLPSGLNLNVFGTKRLLCGKQERSPGDRSPTWKKSLSDRDHPHQSFRTNAEEPRKEWVLICSTRSILLLPFPERARPGDVTTSRSHHRLYDSGNWSSLQKVLILHSCPYSPNNSRKWTQLRHQAKAM